jgi:hypothetical protein
MDTPIRHDSQARIYLTLSERSTKLVESQTLHLQTCNFKRAGSIFTINLRGTVAARMALAPQKNRTASINVVRLGRFAAEIDRRSIKQLEC